MGSAIVRLLRKEGHIIVFTYHGHKPEAERLAKETESSAVPFDIADAASCNQLAALVSNGHFDGFVHAAATPIPRRGVFTSTNPSAFTSYVTTELAAAIQLAHTFAEKAKSEKRTASCVFILTECTLGMPPQHVSEYVTLKYALLGLTRSMAADLAPFNIRANAVSPGLMRTNFVSSLPERVLEMEEEDAPMKRLSTPEDTAHAIAFLLSPRASYITGINIPIVGGLTC